MKISVVIAAYNEAENIGPLISRLIATLNGMSECTWQLILVIEGTDKTRSIAEQFAALQRGIQILYNPLPSGLAKAFRTGFSAVDSDSTLVVTMDADLNHQPEEIPRLVRKLTAEAADIVVGSRKVAGSTTTATPFWKRALSNSFNRSMRSLIGMPIADMTSGFRVYRAAVISKMTFQNTGFAFLPEILMRAQSQGYRILEEPIQFIFRVAGDSKMRVIPTVLSYGRLLVHHFLSLQSSAAICVIISALVIRLLLLYPVHKFQADADAILAGLCGMDVLHGQFPTFFPGGHRLGAQSCYVSAASFFLFGVSRDALAATGLVFAAFFLLFTYLYLKQAFGRTASLSGLLLAAFPPLQIIVNTYVPWAYGEILMYCASTLWLATLLAKTRRTGIWFFLLGLSGGLAFWCSAQSLMVTAPIAGWLLVRRVFVSRRQAALTVTGILIGTAPVEGYYLSHGLAGLAHEGSVQPVHSMAQLVANTSYLVFHLVPWLLTERQGDGLTIWSGAETLMILYGLSLSFVAYLVLWPKSVGKRQPEIFFHTLLLGLILVCSATLFVVSGAGSIRGWSVRYILPLYLVFPGAVAIIYAMSNKAGRLITVCCIAFVVVMNLRQYPFEGSPVRTSLHQALIVDQHFVDWLNEQHIRVVLGDYWDVYSLNFDSKHSIIGVPLMRNDDYFHYGDRLPSEPVRWAIVDKTSPHLTKWAHQLGVKGELFPFGEDHFVFLPVFERPEEAVGFLDLARASALR